MNRGTLDMGTAKSRAAKRFALVMAVVFFGLSALAGAAGAETSDNSAAVEQLDRLLEATPPDESIQIGDMLFKRPVVQAMRDRLAGVNSEGAGDAEPRPWTNGVVPYEFDAGSNITAAERERFVDAALEWTAFANLTFVPKAAAHTSWIVVKKPSSNGCNSHVGMTGGAQPLNLQAGCWVRSVLLHEIGHAIGFHHEHQRSDRDTFVDVYPDRAAQPVWYHVLNPPTTNWTPYDFLSIMHYGRGGVDDDPATYIIVPKPPNAHLIDEIGKQSSTSRFDRQATRTVYGPAAQAPSGVVTNTRDSGPGSLRAAIQYAADRAAVSPGATTNVVFRIPTTDPGFDGAVFTIRPTAGLPPMGDGTIIDGASQTAFTGNTNTSGPEVVVSGSKAAAAGEFGSGFLMKGVNSSIRSLIVNGFVGGGVLITGPRATGNTVLGCYLGTSRTGAAAALPARGAGVSITDGAHGNTIGGVAASGRNIVSGNESHGVVIEGGGTNGNVVQGNYIGLNRTGSAALPNGYGGVHLGTGARSNVIGGTVAGARNVVSGNNGVGVTISGAGTNLNRVEGNLIGTNAAGTAALGNTGSGVWVFGGAQSNTVGGTSAAARNVLSGNTHEGVSIGGAGTNGNIVRGNFVGLSAAGTAKVPNGLSGAFLGSGARSNVIGGTIAGAGNVLSGNDGAGVMIHGAGTSGNRLEGNFIGTNPAGSAASGNNGSGVYVFGGAPSNRIGGTSTSARNVISGNAQNGLVLDGAGTNLNRVEGNFIGTNAAGSGDLGNVWTGVSVYGGAQSNVLGGTAAGAGNTISGNDGGGVNLSGANTRLNRLEGNRIGLNAGGSGAVANGSSGVWFFDGASANTIGGTVASARNYVSSNNGNGVVVSGATTTSNVIYGNTIGRRPTGEAAGNLGDGVLLDAGTTGNQIGGTAAGTGNVISANGRNGIELWGATTVRNPIRGNSFSANARQAIALASAPEDGNGVSPNDTGDGDTGPNQVQNFPTLTSAVTGSGTAIRGSLKSTASTTFRIEYFSSPSADSGGYGEGATFLGARTVTTDGVGNTPLFVYTASVAVPAGHSITATATDPSGNTSEFSKAVVVRT